MFFSNGKKFQKNVFLEKARILFDEAVRQGFSTQFNPNPGKTKMESMATAEPTVVDVKNESIASKDAVSTVGKVFDLLADLETRADDITSMLESIEPAVAADVAVKDESVDSPAAAVTGKKRSRTDDDSDDVEVDVEVEAKKIIDEARALANDEAKELDFPTIEKCEGSDFTPVDAMLTRRAIQSIRRLKNSKNYYEITQRVLQLTMKYADTAVYNAIQTSEFINEH